MILLVGNFLSKHGFNPTAIEDLNSCLSTNYEVKNASDKKNPFFRLVDIIFLILNNHSKSKILIVDVFSTKAILFSWIAIILGKICHIPYVPVLRGGDLAKKHSRNLVYFNYFLKKSKNVICPSAYLAKNFLQINNSIKIIPNYIDVKKIIFTVRNSYRPSLLWVRSIHQIYNPEMAIHVLNKLRIQYPESTLCMVGPNKDNTHLILENLINKYHLNSQISFVGKLSKDEWYKLSENFDIFINTTNIDNYPVSVLEAMALGLPVISTNVGGMSELIDNNKTGFLIDKGDVNAMVNLIEKIVENSLVGNKIATNARKHAELHDKNVILPKWHELINESYGE